MSEEVVLIELQKLAIAAAALSRRARRLIKRYHVERPPKDTRAPAVTGAGKGDQR
ncbi:MAG: hypothetical protein WC969_14880 [Elusimicrobiota bacterium]|jgi:hypothetical protein